MATSIIRIAIGSDHRGFYMKEFLQQPNLFSMFTISWIDVGAHTDERSNYPEFAIAAVEKMHAGNADYGVLICGTGVGMAIAANRFAGIYAALVWNENIARASKEDDNANILVIPSDYVSNELAGDMITAWLHAEFKKGRYQQRIAMIDAITAK